LKRMVTTDNKGRAWKTVGSALVVGCGGAGGLAESHLTTVSKL